jgi:3-oxoacyl-[acyl-carrier protein] reductase
MHEELIREFSLEGRVAVITGGASGIAREASRVMAQAGAKVVPVDIDEAGLAQTAALVAAAGGEAMPRRVDVCDREAVQALADETMGVLGRLDVWINAAGVLADASIVDASEAHVDRIIGVNQKGVFWGCAAAGRVMQAQGRGSIINVSSAGAEMPPPQKSVYSMTKAAVAALTRCAAHEFGPAGVRVNAVAPGWVETPMTAYRFRDESGQEMGRQGREAVLKQMALGSPLRLTGVPRDIALAMLYLASDASRFVTGQILRPNGGVLML